MLALTIDLVMVLAAWATVFFVWQGRQRFRPSSIWEKLMVGSALVGLALTVRLSGGFWGRIPWSPLSDPRVQEAVTVIALLGGLLAIAAGLVEWFPQLRDRIVRTRWQEFWAALHEEFDRRLARVESAEQVVSHLVETVSDMCATARVHFCPFRQQDGSLQGTTTLDGDLRVRSRMALDKVINRRRSMVVNTPSGWMVMLPVVTDQRLYGVIVALRGAEHASFSGLPLLGQTTRRAASALQAVIHQASIMRQTRLATVTAELEQMMGVAADPTTDLLQMFDRLRTELDIDYAACLVYEGDGAYARRYSRTWDRQVLTERGLQVAIEHEILPRTGPSNQALVQSGGTAMLSPAALPHPKLRHRLVVPLQRGRQTTGLLIVASGQKALKLSAADMLHRFRPAFTTAVERIDQSLLHDRLARRLQALGRVAARPFSAQDSRDILTARMLDEIPGTFCQYMRLAPDGRSLKVEYRRARRAGWGTDTAGRRFDMSQLPTCRMVIENGRSILFRQDDPERHFDTHEADALFGAEPHSLLVVPVMQDGQCLALLAVGEMREPRRHTYTTDDRRFADSLARLHTWRTDGRSVAATTAKGPLGDLKLTFASPLTGILGSVEILRQRLGRKGAELKYLDVIERNASRIRDSVNDFAETNVVDQAALHS